MQYGKNAGIARVLYADGHPGHAGMGIVVGPRHVLTCAHVVTEAVGSDESELRPRQPITFDFPMITSDATCSGVVVAWKPLGGKAQYDVAVIELTEAVPAEAGTAILADVVEVLDRDPLSVFGIEQGETSGNHFDSVFVGSSSATDIQIDAVKDRGIFVQPGFSGAAVWDARHEVVIGMVSAIYEKPGVRTAYMTPTRTIAEVWPELPYEQRRMPILLEWLWTGVGALFLALMFYLFRTSLSSDKDVNAPLAAFCGMHLYVIVGLILTAIWIRHARNYRLHDWYSHIPRFARLNFGPDTEARRSLALLSLLVLAVVPGYVQVHFIRKFHVDGHVYIYAQNFGYTQEELSRATGLPCLDRQQICPHACAGRYSLVTPRPPAEGGYWNSMYRYGEPRNNEETRDNGEPRDDRDEQDVRESMVFYPILQPIVVIVLTLFLMAMQILAAIKPQAPVAPATPRSRR